MGFMSIICCYTSVRDSIQAMYFQQYICREVFLCRRFLLLIIPITLLYVTYKNCIYKKRSIIHLWVRFICIYLHNKTVTTVVLQKQYNRWMRCKKEMFELNFMKKQKKRVHIARCGWHVKMLYTPLYNTACS